MLSHAQTLPTTILILIFEYLLESSPYDVEVDSDNEEGGHEQPMAKQSIVLTAVALASCCRHWRSTALEVIFGESKVDCSLELNKHCRRLNPKMLSNSLSLATELGVDTVVHFATLSLNLGDILDGTALDRFSTDRVYPSVKNIRLKIRASPADVDSDLLQQIALAAEFCNFVDRVFPSVSGVAIQHVNCRSWSNLSGPFLDQLFSGLVKGKTSVVFGAELAAMHPAGLSNVIRSCNGSLLQLVAFGISKGPGAGEILRRNANTLERLMLGTKDPRMLYDILHDENGSPVVYRELVRLDIIDNCEQSTHANDYCMPSDGSSFPKLKSLTTLSDSPDLIEFLFRGAGRTLSIVEVILKYSTTERLIQAGLFDTRRYPNLQQLGFVYKGHDDMLMPSVYPASIALQFGRNASRLNMEPGYLTLFSECISDFSNLSQSIQILGAKMVSATIDEVLGFVKYRPFLRHMSISTDIPEEQVERYADHVACADGCIASTSSGSDIAPGDLPEDPAERFIHTHIGLLCADNRYLEDLAKKWYPLSERLTTFELYVYQYQLEGIALVTYCSTVVSLFLLCPCLRTIHGGQFSDLRTIHRSQLEAYAEFREMERRLSTLATDQ